MAVSKKPTVVISHGAWHGPTQFEIFSKELAKLGYADVVCSDHPSCNDRPGDPDFPKTSLYDDALALNKTLTHLVREEHKQIIVIGFSYGGMVLTQAVTPELFPADSESEGVVGLIYASAFLVDNGEALRSVEQNHPDPNKPADAKPLFDQLPDGRTVPLGHDWFFHDMSQEDMEYWNSTLRIMVIGGFSDPITVPSASIAWRHLPTMYNFCTLDKAIPLYRQKIMVELAEKAGAKNIKTSTLESAHSPFLSQPANLAADLDAFASSLVGSGK